MFHLAASSKKASLTCTYFPLRIFTRIERDKQTREVYQVTRLFSSYLLEERQGSTQVGEGEVEVSKTWPLGKRSVTLLYAGLYQGEGILTILAGVEGSVWTVFPSSCGTKIDNETPRRSANPTGSTLATLTSQGSTMESNTFCANGTRMERGGDQKNSIAGVGQLKLIKAVAWHRIVVENARNMVFLVSTKKRN